MTTPPDRDTTNIVLTGFMGTGKSTVGRLLAARLGFEFVDTDEVIEQRHGPITTIFAEQGEDAFRSLERRLAAELGDRKRLVIATGGRMMLDEANIAALSRNGLVLCLVATPEQILERVMSDRSGIERPLLAVPDPRQRIIELLAERSSGYGRFAQLATGARSPEAIADDIAELARSDPERFVVEARAPDAE